MENKAGSLWKGTLAQNPVPHRLIFGKYALAAPTFSKFMLFSRYYHYTIS